MITIFPAPFHPAQGGRPQILPIVAINLIFRGIVQADKQHGSRFELLGRLQAHALFAVIEGHGRIFAMKAGAEQRKNQRRMRGDALIFPFFNLKIRLTGFFDRRQVER